MSCLSRAVLFFEEDAAIPAESKPLMLESVCACPLLTWVNDQFRKEGIGRFFVVCGPRFAEEVRRCVPEAEVSEQAADLNAFLNTPDAVLVLPRAAFPMPEAGPGFAYAASGYELQEAWKVRMTNAVQGAELVPGWLPVYNMDTVAEIDGLMRTRQET